MAVNPLKKMEQKLSYFEDSGPTRQKYPLIMAVYHNATDLAEKLIREDPAQINDQDPYAGLSPLHIAIFRQNVRIIGILLKQPTINLRLRDSFGRRAQDFLDYTVDPEIHRLITNACYPDAIRRLEDEALDQAIAEGKIVRWKPEEP